MGKKKNGFFLLLAVLCISAVLSARGPECAAAEGRLIPGSKTKKTNEWIGSGPEGKLLVVFLEFNDLLCCLCTDSLLNLLRVLPLPVQKEKTWMVIVFDSERQSEHQKKIIFTKVKGFMRGNGLHIPYCVDFSHSLGHMCQGGSLILLMDGSTRSVDIHPLPLDRGLRSQLIERLLR